MEDGEVGQVEIDGDRRLVGSIAGNVATEIVYVDLRTLERPAAPHAGRNFSDAVLADRLDDPALVFASEAAADAPAVVMETSPS